MSVLSSEELRHLIDKEPQFCIPCCTIYDESVKVESHVCKHCSEYRKRQEESEPNRRIETMTFTTAEILEDIQEKTLAIPAGNGGLVTQEICEKAARQPAKFMRGRVERVIESLPAKES